MLTQEQLKKALNYNLESGDFRWLITHSNRTKKGSIAGSTSGRGYRRITINGEVYRAHSLAWLYTLGYWPKDQIDHENHIRDDNAWINLREVTPSENNKNMSRAKNNTSGVTGVSWINPRRKWLAQIKINRKQINLGRFNDKFEAICARMSANNKYGFHKNHGAENNETYLY